MVRSGALTDPFCLNFGNLADRRCFYCKQFGGQNRANPGRGKPACETARYKRHILCYNWKKDQKDPKNQLPSNAGLGLFSTPPQNLLPLPPKKTQQLHANSALSLTHAHRPTREPPKTQENGKSDKKGA